MIINITDMTPSASRLEFAKIEDIYGDTLVVRGWR